MALQCTGRLGFIVEFVHLAPLFVGDCNGKRRTPLVKRIGYLRLSLALGGNAQDTTSSWSFPGNVLIFMERTASGVLSE
jgi:hypothetical protein